MSAQPIPVIEIPAKDLNHFDPNNFSFGKNFTNYMLEAEYSDGAWKNVIIKKKRNFLMEKKRKTQCTVTFATLK